MQAKVARTQPRKGHSNSASNVMPKFTLYLAMTYLSGVRFMGLYVVAFLALAVNIH